MVKHKKVQILELIIIILIFILAIIWKVNSMILTFLGMLTFLTFYPTIFIKFKSEEESDIFSHKYFSPIALAYFISSIFILAFQKELASRDSYFLIIITIVMMIIYLINHHWMLKKYGIKMV